MKQIVKIMSDGISNEVAVEAEDHETAVQLLFEQLRAKNEEGKMLSEQMTIFSKDGIAKHTIMNVLLDEPIDYIDYND